MKKIHQPLAIMACLLLCGYGTAWANTSAKAQITEEGAAVDPSLCRALTKHRPDADVAYQSGVDVRGNAVAPADLPDQPQLQIPHILSVPLTLSLAKTLHLDTSAYPANGFGSGTEIPLGTLTIDGDRVLFNGKILSDSQQDNLAVLCLKPGEK